MSGNYYYLLSGLPEPDEKKAPELLETAQADLEQLLSDQDREAFYFFLYRNDNKNLLKILRDRDGLPSVDEVDFYRPCRFSHEDLENALAGAFELPEYMQDFLNSDIRVESSDQLRDRENMLISLYYRAALSHKSSFVREWFQFKEDLKNIIQALNAKAYGLPVEQLLVGESDLIDILSKQPSIDTALQKLYPFLLTLQDHIENKRLVELEKTIETLLLSFVEERAALNPFGFSSVLYRFLKISYDFRWYMLTEEAGKEALERQIETILDQANLELSGETR